LRSTLATGIKKVEASIDGGRSWQDAMLGKNLGRYSFREWSLPIAPKEPGPFGLLVRATAVSGETQPSEASWNPAGYARNVIESLNIVAA
jgi:sulfite dehydrogenase